MMEWIVSQKSNKKTWKFVDKFLNFSTVFFRGTNHINLRAGLKRIISRLQEKIVEIYRELCL